LGQNRRLSSAMESWSVRQKESGHGGFPNLGFGGTLVAVFLTSYFAAQIGNALLVIIYLGPRAFFVQGIRVTDWKHGLFSNGAPAPFTGPMTFVWWMLLLALTEIAAGVFRSFLSGKPHWVTTTCRFVGGGILLVFSSWLYRDGWHPFHPIPLSCLIGGVMTWLAVFRKSHPNSSP